MGEAAIMASKSVNYEKRTTSQFVFAAGINNVTTEGKIDNSNFRYYGSHFYEVGATYNTRLFKESNLPEKVDENFINSLLVKIRKSVYGIQ